MREPTDSRGPTEARNSTDLCARTALGGAPTLRRKHLKTLLRPKKPHVYATIRIPLNRNTPYPHASPLSILKLARKLLCGGREDLVGPSCYGSCVIRCDARGAS